MSERTLNSFSLPLGGLNAGNESVELSIDSIGGRNRNGWTARYRVHRFDQICNKNGIEHRLTKPKHPWTNGQVERMNRTTKEATVKRFYYETHEQLRSHLTDFVSAYNFAKRLKTLKGLTPYEHICKAWTNEPERFTLDPLHQMPGLT